MGCLNGKLLTNRTNQATASSVCNPNNGEIYPKHDNDSLDSCSPDQDKLLQEQRLNHCANNGTNQTNDHGGGKIRGPKKSKYMSKLLPSLAKSDAQTDDGPQPSPSASGTNSKSAANGGGGVSFFGRRLCVAGSSKNADGIGSPAPAGHQQNGSILHSLGTLLENGCRNASASPRLSAGSSYPRPGESNLESNLDSPLTPDRLHKNFQERLLTSQVSRNTQKLTDSQLEFFRMLDEKIAQGQEEDSWDSKSAA